MPSTCRALLLLACLVTVVKSAPRGESRNSKKHMTFDHGVDLPTNRPLIIAHRGSSGTLLEHTVKAYKLAVEQGADVIECDATITKDLVLICMHECWMKNTTNVAKVYPSRMKTYYVHEKRRYITDYFTVDFTLSELSKVRKLQRVMIRGKYRYKKFGIATLEDLISVAQNSGRPVGIYIETKDPVFINSVIQNSSLTFEDLILDTLRRYGYTHDRSPCFLQSFNEGSLRYFANRTSLPLVQLLPLMRVVSDYALAKYKEYAYGIAPDKRQLVRKIKKAKILNLVQRAHAIGLRVHPYTFRNENQSLAKKYGGNPDNEYADFFQLGVDGLFTNFPATYYNFLNNTYYNAWFLETQ